MTEAIERINKHHDEMRDKFIKRMQIIQSEADEYATIVTRIQTQLDRGLEEGRQIHQCKSDADVMRRQEALTMAADSLHNITVPVTFDVTNSLRINYAGMLIDFLLQLGKILKAVYKNGSRIVGMHVQQSSD